MLRPHLLLAIALVAPAAAQAADPAPEIRRAAAAPQAIGMAHTLRTSPVACARLGVSCDGFELDAGYLDEAVARVRDAGTDASGSHAAEPDGGQPSLW